MAINFPATTGQATDGTFTYTVAGIVYAWNGSSWQAAGAGASATDRSLFSVTTNSVGTAALSYNNNSGIFSYTPPDLSSFLTAETDTLATVTGRGSTTTDRVTVNNLFDVSNITLQTSGNIDLIQSYSVNGFEIENNNSIRLQQTGFPNHEYASFSSSGGVTLRQNNNIKLTTTSTGVTVTGALTAGGLTYPTTNGTSGDVLTSDGSGNVTWSAPTGLQSRATISNTSSLANDATANVSFTTPKTYVLLKVETSHSAWVTLYSDTSSRTADASRQISVDPIPGSGVLAEVITTGAQTQLITPGAVCFNSSGSGTTYAKIVNKSGSTANVQVTLTYVALEA